MTTSGNAMTMPSSFVPYLEFDRQGSSASATFQQPPCDEDPQEGSPARARELVAQYMAQCQTLGLAPHKQLVRWLWKVKPHLGVINLSHIELSSDQLGCLTQALQYHPEVAQVHSLSLNFTSLDDLAAITIATFAHHHLPLLHTLELFGNALTDQCCPALRSLLQMPNGKLQRLKLGDNHITCHGAVVLSQGLIENGSLALLHLGNNRIGNNGVMALSEALLRNSTLTSLCLRDNQFGPMGMSALCVVLANHPTLADVQLKGNAIFQPQSPSQGQSSALCTPAMAQLAHLVTSHAHLRVLDLQQTGMTSSDAMALAQGLMHNPQIHAVNLNDNQIGDSGCEAIMQVLVKTGIFATVGLRSNGIDVQGAKTIGQALLANSSLTGMDVAMNKFGDAGALVIGYALQFNSSLQSLDIRGNNITVGGSRILAHALCCNRTLKHIDLSNNFNGDQGAKEWARVLTQNTSLTRLSLADSEISDIGGTSLLQALQQNTTIRYFGIGGLSRLPPVANQLSNGLRKALRMTLQQHGGRMIGEKTSGSGENNNNNSHNKARGSSSFSDGASPVHSHEGEIGVGSPLSSWRSPSTTGSSATPEPAKPIIRITASPPLSRTSSISGPSGAGGSAGRISAVPSSAPRSPELLSAIHTSGLALGIPTLGSSSGSGLLTGDPNWSPSMDPIHIPMLSRSNSGVSVAVATTTSGATAGQLPIIPSNMVGSPPPRCYPPSASTTSTLSHQQRRSSEEQSVLSSSSSAMLSSSFRKESDDSMSLILAPQNRPDGATPISPILQPNSLPRQLSTASTGSSSAGGSALYFTPAPTGSSIFLCCDYDFQFPTSGSAASVPISATTDRLFPGSASLLEPTPAASRTSSFDVARRVSSNSGVNPIPKAAAAPTIVGGLLSTHSIW